MVASQCARCDPALMVGIDSSCIPHPASLILHPSSLILHPSSLIPHPSSLIPHPLPDESPQSPVGGRRLLWGPVVPASIRSVRVVASAFYVVISIVPASSENGFGLGHVDRGCARVVVVFAPVSFLIECETRENVSSPQIEATSCMSPGKNGG